MAKAIKPREREAIIQSLRAGVTPRTGLHHIQVGRAGEVEALVTNIDTIIDNGAVFRLVIGDFGSGKSFFLRLVRQIALEKGLVTVSSDLSPDRRLHSTSGQAKSLYNELMRNMSTRTKPDGGALPSIVEKFIIVCRKQAEEENQEVEKVVHEKLHQVEELVGGYDFARVVTLYYQGYEQGNENLQNDAIRWLRGEWPTKTEARQALGVRSIVEDSTVYDYLKIWSLFVQAAGYGGLLVSIDELVNLYKLGNKQARVSNYEQILRILNDCLQGSANSIGFVMGGTPEFLLDPRKGLYSYEALRSRLAENTFAKQAGVVDYSSPTLHMNNLNPEEMYILLKNIRLVFAAGDEDNLLLPDEALKAFLAHCHEKIGESYFRTPRNTIKAFVDLLTVLDQNSQVEWQQLIQSVKVENESNTAMPELESSERQEKKAEDNEQLSSFTL